MLFDVLNNNFLSRHSCLAADHGHIPSHFQSACALGVLLLCCQSLQFLETNISQGSVATPLSFGWICNDRFIANFLPSVTVKNVENRSILGEDVDKSLVSWFLPARRYASAVIATATCLAVCPSVRHTPVLCLAERKQDREMYTV